MTSTSLSDFWSPEVHYSSKGILSTHIFAVFVVFFFSFFPAVGQTWPGHKHGFVTFRFCLTRLLLVKSLAGVSVCAVVLCILGQRDPKAPPAEGHSRLFFSSFKRPDTRESLPALSTCPPGFGAELLKRAGPFHLWHKPHSNTSFLYSEARGPQCLGC